MSTRVNSGYCKLWIERITFWLDRLGYSETQVSWLFQEKSRNSHDQHCKFIMRLAILSQYKFGFNNSSAVHSSFIYIHIITSFSQLFSKWHYIVTTVGGDKWLDLMRDSFKIADSFREESNESCYKSLNWFARNTEFSYKLVTWRCGSGVALNGPTFVDKPKIDRLTEYCLWNVSFSLTSCLLNCWVKSISHGEMCCCSSF